MMGIFVQLNEHQPAATRQPIGYVIEESGCWSWVGSVDKDGYGRWVVSNRVTQRAHRVMYERIKGPIPEGLTIDHLCKNTGCINPDHLEAVTMRENLLRGDSFSGTGARQTHCKRGHPLSGDNLAAGRTARGTPTRVCRTCNNENQRRRYRERMK